MVLFDIFTIHGASNNLGEQPRAGYTLRFMPSTSHYDKNPGFYRKEGAFRWGR
jgi:ectoine hydroxylase-related dioxygenase (phytanoyl-CoA dioxygenase family)